MATCVLFGATAFGADAPPIPTVPVNVPWWVPLLATIVAAARTYYSDNTPRWTTLEAKWRAAIVVGLAAVGTLLQQLISGTDIKTAVITFALLGVPSIVQEILKAAGTVPTAGSGGGAVTPIAAADAAPKTSIRPPGGYSAKLVPVLASAMLVAVPTSLAFSGCAFLNTAKDVTHATANTIIEACDEATSTLSALHFTADVYFEWHPNDQNKAKVDGYFADAALAIATARSTASGATDISDEDFNKAFADFRTAYADLTQVLHDLGIVEAPQPSGIFGVAKRGGGKRDVPVPMAAKLRGKK